MLTPKADELVATPYRFGGSKAKAEEHFERGFVQTFTRIREQHAPDTVSYPHLDVYKRQGLHRSL